MIKAYIGSKWYQLVLFEFCCLHVLCLSLIEIKLILNYSKKGKPSQSFSLQGISHVLTLTVHGAVNGRESAYKMDRYCTSPSEAMMNPVINARLMMASDVHRDRAQLSQPMVGLKARSNCSQLCSGYRSTDGLQLFLNRDSSRYYRSSPNRWRYYCFHNKSLSSPPSWICPVPVHERSALCAAEWLEEVQTPLTESCSWQGRVYTIYGLDLQTERKVLCVGANWKKSMFPRALRYIII